MELTRAQAENKVLNRIIEVVFSSTDLDRLLSLAADLILEAVSGDACFVYLFDDERERLVLKGATEPSREMVDRVDLALGEGITGWVAEHKEPAIVRGDTSEDRRVKHIPELGLERYTSLISVPLVSPTDRLTGVVNVHTVGPREFEAEDVAFLEHVASLAGAAIEHGRLIRELGAKERALQDIIARTIQAQEDERRRVATEIHDGVTQQLISIWYRLNACERFLGTNDELAAEELESAKGLVDEALDEARTAIYQLRPSTLDDLGLVPALEALASRTLGGEYDVSIAADLPQGLPSHLETALYRIAQEALNNIRKHAGPCRVELTLESSSANQLVMRVADEGLGFDLASYRRARPETAFGLLGMAERVDLIGGRFSMKSAPATGTSIEVTLPLERQPADGFDAA
ncbi:MAG TPA: GAF domain-containing sensor histidine kinase [Actinomycetota bacterium]|nr:GAF domain-containing sensor histidine kinase [Actinomycetota bacterium]